MRTPALTISNISLHYKTNKGKRFSALQDISATIFEGEMVGLIGGNGAGKSTFLKLAAGILEPDSGKIDYHGNHALLLALRVGFTQHLSGRDNALFSSMLLGASKREAESRISEIEEFADIGDKFDEPLMTYSSGMKTRLGFGVALHSKADLLLVDEVLGVGDAKFKKKSRVAMRKKLKDNKTVILASHSNKTISDLTTRAIWLEQGKLVMIDSTDKVIESYEAYHDKG